jgi:hypothetical protein
MEGDTQLNNKPFYFLAILVAVYLYSRVLVRPSKA